MSVGFPTLQTITINRLLYAINGRLYSAFGPSIESREPIAPKFARNALLDPNRIRELLAKFAGIRVMVVGDIFLDENVYGRVTGVSLEAPIPVFTPDERRYNPGAAGNTACNVAALGGETFIVGFVGADPNADVVRREFSNRGVAIDGIVVDSERPTNTYSKIRAEVQNAPPQEMLRMDTNPAPWVSGAVEDAVVANIHALADRVDAIAVVDQINSVVTDRVLDAVRDAARKHRLVTVGDARIRVPALSGFTAVVPNGLEAVTTLSGQIGRQDGGEAEVDAAGAQLAERNEAALLTMSCGGITIYRKGAPPKNVPVLPCKVVDVTGAGDTVTAAVTLALAAEASYEEAAYLGNAAAGIAVEQPGVVTVSREEVEANALGARRTEKNKIVTAEELEHLVEDRQREGKKVVWTNGCFDILHVGHVTYLLKAAREGDVLVVGLNSDASIRALKGPHRPVVPEADRALVLSSLECVDYVTIFDDESPAALLDFLKPDVYAKGGDYTIDTINQTERRIVEEYGGAIALIAGVEGQSTTAIIEKILDDPSLKRTE